MRLDTIAQDRLSKNFLKALHNYSSDMELDSTILSWITNMHTFLLLSFAIHLNLVCLLATNVVSSVSRILCTNVGINMT